MGDRQCLLSVVEEIREELTDLYKPWQFLGCFIKRGEGRWSIRPEEKKR